MALNRNGSPEGSISKKIVTTKGDLITATANAIPSRLAAGSDGDTLVADSAATTGLRWQGNFAAGKNKVINGDFTINQRSFTSNTTNDAFNFDRWFQTNGGTTGTLTITPQTFTPGTAPVSGYEALNFVRCVTASGASVNTYALLVQRIENVRTFAGQTVTLSFWAKANTGTPSIAAELEQVFGTGGSSNVTTALNKVSINTSWTRYSLTATLPSISGKTVGSNSYLSLNFWLSAGSDFNSRTTSLGLQNATFDIWGVQLEAGSVATAFQTATGTLQGELALAQRYYYRLAMEAADTPYCISRNFSTSAARGTIFFPITMRTTPTFGSSTAAKFSVWTNADYAGTSIASIGLNKNNASFQIAVSGTPLTANNATAILSSPLTTDSYLEYIAEL